MAVAQRQTSLTAGTIFAATKLTLRSWFRALYAGCTVVSDGLSYFRGVTAAGCGHQPIRTGSGRKAVLAPAFKWVNTALGNIKTAIVGTYPALRDKHVPRYLAEFEYRYDLAAPRQCAGKTTIAVHLAVATETHGHRYSSFRPGPEKQREPARHCGHHEEEWRRRHFRRITHSTPQPSWRKP